jgi:hypothetical protein
MGTTHFSGPVESENGFTTGTTGIASSVESVTAGRTLVEADNGMNILLGDADSGDVTLPAVTLTGYTVRVTCNFAITASSAVISAEGDNISGVLVVNGATILAEAEDQINFILNLAEIGDYIDLLSDGTSWIVNGIGGAAGSITATDPA